MNRIFTIFAFFASLSLFAQTNVEVSTGAGYINEAYYSFAQGEINSSLRNNWDIAFATNNMDISVQANNGAGVIVYTYPNGDISAWDDIDTTGMHLWPTMYNSVDTMNQGAFVRNAVLGDAFDYGWGRYNMSTHNITGDSLFILKTVDGSYKKFWIVNANPLSGFNTWEFKYADLDGNDEQTITLYADDYLDMNYVHFSIETDEVVAKEPASADWELLFTKYYDYNIPYYVTGVLANTNRVSLLQVDGVDQATYETYTESLFNSNYSEIGSDWKTFNGNSYDLVTDRVYFAKVYTEDMTDSTYWKLYFTAFSGSSEGKYTFMQKNLSDASAVEEISGLELFEIYPNPTNNYIRLITDADKNLEYIITDISGKQISNGNLEKGFNQQSINISELNSGVYHLSLISKEGISSQTFIKQ